MRKIFFLLLLNHSRKRKSRSRAWQEEMVKRNFASCWQNELIKFRSQEPLVGNSKTDIHSPEGLAVCIAIKTACAEIKT